MKKKSKKLLLLSGCAVVATLITGIAFLVFGAVEPSSAVISTGLQHVADQAYVAASAPAGESITFSPEWFDQTLRGDRITAITVTALPDATQGELLLGYGEVSVGQEIRRDNLSYLTYTPLESGDEACFSFVPQTRGGDAGYEISCRLLQGGSNNCCPAAKGGVTAVSTHATLSQSGHLEAEDPEGEALYFEVISYPSHGTLRLNARSGEFTYQPNDGFSGEDRFTWRVQDASGSFSDEEEVLLHVRELATGYLYADVEDTAMHTAALQLTERGLMSGERMGGKHYFHPARKLTRAAFVAILMEAAGVEFEDAEDTGYTDNAEIPRGMRGAIKHAREQGWLGEDSVFRPGDAITRAEAASIAGSVLGLSAPGYSDTVEDHDSIPVAVVDALYATYEGGYLPAMSDGALAPDQALSRGDAALFFARVLQKE